VTAAGTHHCDGLFFRGCPTLPPFCVIGFLRQAVVPLHGLVEVLACGLLLADVDTIGSSATNCGVVWQCVGQDDGGCSLVLHSHTPAHSRAAD
jgi:hypothetical protein